MGLRIPPRSPPLTRPARDGPSEPERHPGFLDLISYPSAFRANLPSMAMVTNFTKDKLVELNGRSDDSCLVVISNKVYDLATWIDDQDDSLARDEVRKIVATDPVGAGCWLADRLGGELESRIAEFRIGEFESVEITPACLDPGGGVSGPANSSNGTRPLSPRPSHLTRALELVEFHKSRVIDAQTTVGTAHVSLAEAYEGLAEAEKKRDHLVMLACEGCRPTLPEWEHFGEDDQGQRYASGSA